MKGWIAITAPDDRSDSAFRSTTGYSFGEYTPHHRHVAVGDIFFLRDQDRLVAIAKIQRLNTNETDRNVRRCPKCGAGQLGFRSTRSASYRCTHGHVFSEPDTDVKSGIEYWAHFGLDYVPIAARIEASELRPFELTNSRQLVLRPCDLGGLLRYIVRRDRNAATVLKAWLVARPLVLLDSDADLSDGPAILDDREHRFHGIRLRRGRKVFRDELIRRYGQRCMISGCTVGALIEAANIPPDSAPKFNNPTNGLLLRSDLHTLFDLNLLAIDPARLVAAIHPSLADPAYRQFDGAPLLASAGRGPNQRALAARWEWYRAGLSRTPAQTKQERSSPSPKVGSLA